MERAGRVRYQKPNYVCDCNRASLRVISYNCERLISMPYLVAMLLMQVRTGMPIRHGSRMTDPKRTIRARGTIRDLILSDLDGCFSVQGSVLQLIGSPIREMTMISDHSRSAEAYHVILYSMYQSWHPCWVL